MSSFWSIVVFTVILSYSVHEAIGLKCYVCDSNDDKNCKDNPKKSRIEDCNSRNFLTQFSDNQDVKALFKDNKDVSQFSSNNRMACMTLKITNIKEHYTRRCASVTYECDGKKEITENKDLKIQLDCCDTDLCNSSFNTRAGLLTLGACLLLTTFFWK